MAPLENFLSFSSYGMGRGYILVEMKLSYIIHSFVSMYE